MQPDGLWAIGRYILILEDANVVVITLRHGKNFGLLLAVASDRVAPLIES